MTKVGLNEGQTLPRLSERQEQCLRGVLDLKSAKEIARDLGVSQHAVEKHLRVVREKFGVDTTADAARLFAMSQTGKDFPHYGLSDLPPPASSGHPDLVPGQVSDWIGHGNGALLLDDQLTPRQTLLTIAAVSLGSIIGLLLLVACAEGIKGLVLS